MIPIICSSGGGGGGGGVEYCDKIQKSNLFACLFQHAHVKDVYAIVINVHLTRPTQIIKQKGQPGQQKFKKDIFRYINKWIEEYKSMICKNHHGAGTAYYTIIIGGDWNRNSGIFNQLSPSDMRSIPPIEKGKEPIDHIMIFGNNSSSSSSSSGGSSRRGSSSSSSISNDRIGSRASGGGGGGGG